MHTRQSDPKEPAGNAHPRRRAILGILGAGALLPDHWTRPIVQTVVLPAHAQTTPGTPPGTMDGDGALAFANCSLSLEFSEMSISTFICGDGNVFQIVPIIGGSIVGDGDLSGITLNISSVFTADGSDVPEDPNLNGIVQTQADGSYMIELDGLSPPAGVEGPHILCACEDGVTYQVTVTVTSDDPRLTGQTVCMETFTCDALPE